MSTDEQTTIKLCVTEEQLELIHAIWAHNNWELQVENMTEGECYSMNRPMQENSRDNSPIHEDYYNSFRIAQTEGAAECPHCLCRPCVTDLSNIQMWWMENSLLPSPENSALRKEKYQRFWTMLLHRGAWADARYKRGKEESIKADKGDTFSGPCNHPRDLMPACVLKTVRSWLPNPENKPYMGHKWI